MQNIDKIAIGAAGLLIILALATFVLPSAASKNQAKIDEASGKIESMIKDQRPPEPEVPEVADALTRQYTSISSTGFGEWNAYRKPAVLVVSKPKDRKPPLHLAATVSAIRQGRDVVAKRPVHTVEGCFGDSENAEIVKAYVESSSGDEWATVAEINGPFINGETFSLQIGEGLQSGVSYSYRVVTEAQSTSDIPLEGEGVSKTSNEVGPALVPFDFAWEVSSVQLTRADPNAPGGIQHGSAFIRFYEWDYEKGEAIRSSSNRYTAKARTEWKEGAAIHGTTNRILQIQEGKNPEGERDRYVELRDIKLGRSSDVKIWGNMPPSPLTAEDVIGESCGEDGNAENIVDQGASADADPQPVSAEEESAAPAPASGGSDDDSDW